MMASPDPQPLLLEPDADDPFLRALFEEFGGRPRVVVPIAARGEFFGVLSVSVTSDRERLRLSPELLDRLAGVVAHPATALDNAPLFDPLTPQAPHHNLTRLL